MDTGHCFLATVIERAGIDGPDVSGHGRRWGDDALAMRPFAVRRCVLVRVSVSAGERQCLVFT